MTYNEGMAKSKSFGKSLLSAAAFAAVVASVSYVTYRALTSSRDSDMSKRRRPKGSISRRKARSSGNVRSSDGDSPALQVEWIPNLRVREQKILNMMPAKQEISMTDIKKHFPDVTKRTLRRDLDRLAEKGRVRKAGSTRSTTYLKV